MSVFPLYRTARESRPALRAGSSHPGLWYEKFFDRWEDEAFDAIEEKGKQRWIATVAGPNVGAAALMGEQHARRTRLIEGGLGGAVLTLTLQSPFVTGLGYEHPVENGFLWHPLLGAPYLPGSSVKGLLHAWAGTWNDGLKDHMDRILGTEKHVGAWIVFDALPVQPVGLACEVMTPHDGGWRIQEGVSATPSDWVSPNPIPFLVVLPGAQFSFAFAPRRGVKAVDGDRDRVESWLRDALDCLGAGGKTAIGFGRFA